MSHRKKRGGGGRAILSARPRSAWFRTILVSATLLGMLASMPLWSSTRLFPAIPVARGFPAIGAPWDRILFGALLLSLVAALRFYRAAVPLFLAGVLVLVLADQNRIQPWLYLYAVALAVGLAPEPTAMAGWRVLLSAVYFWSGLQKFNDEFFEEVVPWFVAGAAEWAPAALLPVVKAGVLLAAPAEILIGICVWFRRLRRAAVAAAFLLHGTVLVLLGPLGQNFNLVVWPWNLSMPLLMLAAFPPRSLRTTLPDLRWSPAATVVVALFCLLPALSFVGAWDTALSFRVYSGNLAKADLLVSPELRDRLPPALRRHVRWNVKGALSLDIFAWALSEIGTPPLCEPRGYRAIGRYVAQYARGPREVRLVVVPPHGPMRTYEQEELVAPLENP